MLLLLYTICQSNSTSFSRCNGDLSLPVNHSSIFVLITVVIFFSIVPLGREQPNGSSFDFVFR
ncbi:AAEL017035-PA [Aedes aegypti]|uniref:AAEL017035-PA n=1 Tax=Aedes aegypti TaxID=7159 RepID=J9HFR1_AEDAE|nr:AAEL017035-PA [Aedes aegypti]